MKLRFETTIQRFATRGEKTGWTYVDIPADIAQKLKPGNRQGFRVKGLLDRFAISGVSLLPMGQGNFILPLNAALRKGIGKRHGAVLKVELEEDKTPVTYDADLLQCLGEEPAAKSFFYELSKSHQGYYSKWIASAKTEATKAKRIAQCIEALLRKQHYGEMLHWLRDHRP
jgi:Domain of unknown function (DUF1905)/Bacteriocin-protection, YdeI or OmpD-Associated